MGIFPDAVDLVPFAEAVEVDSAVLIAVTERNHVRVGFIEKGDSADFLVFENVLDQ
jgi:hypothetical protein